MNKQNKKICRIYKKQTINHNSPTANIYRDKNLVVPCTQTIISSINYTQLIS